MSLVSDTVYEVKHSYHKQRTNKKAKNLFDDFVATREDFLTTPQGEFGVKIHNDQLSTELAMRATWQKEADDNSPVCEMNISFTQLVGGNYCKQEYADFYNPTGKKKFNSSYGNQGLQKSPVESLSEFMHSGITEADFGTIEKMARFADYIDTIRQALQEQTLKPALYYTEPKLIA